MRRQAVSGARRALRSAVRSGGTTISRLARRSGEAEAVRVLTVGRGADELRELWSDPVRLGRVLAEPYTGHPSAWRSESASVVAGRVRFLARSGHLDPMRVSGTVSFAPAPQDLGTEVTLTLVLEDPLPGAGAPAVGAMAHKALRRAKALAETGEIPTLEHNPSARHDPTGQDS
jgi:hypothetical protein